MPQSKRLSLSFYTREDILKISKELLGKVFENAKENASEICKTIGKTPGEVVKIVGDHPKTETWVSYLGNNYPEYWTLSVTYKME